MCESLFLVWGSEFVLCVGPFGEGLGEWVSVECGTVSCGFVGVSLCCVWERFVSVWRSEYVLCVEQCVAGFGGVNLCCVCESLVWVLGSEFVMCVGEYGAGLEE